MAYPEPAIYWVKLESQLITEDDMLPVGHCQVPPPLRPLQAETTVVGSQQGLLCGSICPVTTRQESVVNRFLIRAVKARALKKRSCRTILSNAQSCRGVVFRGAPEDLPGTKDPVAACLLSMRLTVARVKPTRAAIAPCLMPKLSQCEDWFGGTTTYTVVSELDDLTWPCIECLPRVVSDFVGEQSRVHIMPISAKWKHKSAIQICFIVFNGGVTTFFAKSVCATCNYLVHGQAIAYCWTLHDVITYPWTVYLLLDISGQPSFISILYVESLRNVVCANAGFEEIKK